MLELENPCYWQNGKSYPTIEKEFVKMKMPVINYFLDTLFSCFFGVKEFYSYIEKNCKIVLYCIVLSYEALY